MSAGSNTLRVRQGAAIKGPSTSCKIGWVRYHYGQHVASLTSTARGAGERWPPPRSDGDSDGGWASDDEPGSDRAIDTITEEGTSEPQSSGGGGDVGGSCAESAPKVPLDALPPCSTLEPKTMQAQMSDYLEKAMPGFIAAVHWGAPSSLLLVMHVGGYVHAIALCRFFLADKCPVDRPESCLV